MTFEKHQYQSRYDEDDQNPKPPPKARRLKPLTPEQIAFSVAKGKEKKATSDADGVPPPPPPGGDNDESNKLKPPFHVTTRVATSDRIGECYLSSAKSYSMLNSWK